MPHTQTARKRGRQNAKRRLRNRAAKKSLKQHMKNVLSAAQSGPGDKLQAELRAAIKNLDKAAAKRVIHPNTAARRKSQLARLVNSKAQPPAAK